MRAASLVGPAAELQRKVVWLVWSSERSYDHSLKVRGGTGGMPEVVGILWFATPKHRDILDQARSALPLSLGNLTGDAIDVAQAICMLRRWSKVLIA